MAHVFMQLLLTLSKVCPPFSLLSVSVVRIILALTRDTSPRELPVGDFAQVQTHLGAQGLLLGFTSGSGAN